MVGPGGGYGDVLEVWSYGWVKRGRVQLHGGCDDDRGIADALVEIFARRLFVDGEGIGKVEAANGNGLVLNLLKSTSKLCSKSLLIRCHRNYLECHNVLHDVGGC